MAASPTPRPSRRAPSPRALDVASFCREAATIDGQWPLAELQRLAASLVPGDANTVDAAVRWRAVGSLQSAGLRAGVCTIDLEVQAMVPLECQRCLRPLRLPLEVQRRVHFVTGEDDAARLDEELEDDVLALPQRLDLRELIEDELVLALPLVPRHEDCPGGSEAVTGPGGHAATTGGTGHEPDGAGAPEHPFAALAAWRKRNPPG